MSSDKTILQIDRLPENADYVCRNCDVKTVTELVNQCHRPDIVVVARRNFTFLSSRFYVFDHALVSDVISDISRNGLSIIGDMIVDKVVIENREFCFFLSSRTSKTSSNRGEGEKTMLTKPFVNAPVSSDRLYALAMKAKGSVTLTAILKLLKGFLIAIGQWDNLIAEMESWKDQTPDIVDEMIDGLIAWLQEV